MSEETVIYSVAEGVASITMNRPEARNALTRPMYDALSKAFTNASRDKAVRAIVLTGSGQGFCSGQDLRELEPLIAQNLRVGDLLRSGLNQLIHTIRSVEKPVIGAVNGVAAGAGASLALATDVRIASAEASFVFAAFVNIGIIPDGGGTYLLQKLVGTAKALELAWLADARQPLSAHDAQRLGIVAAVASADTFAQQVGALAARLAAMPTLALGRSKRAIYKAAERTLAEALEYEAQVQDAMFATQDFHEGVSAFIEKRTPQFRGE
jgi:2-(1,2-epoxy-1,2-dihydrophenyl)acetyl-CoA isomerase